MEQQEHPSVEEKVIEDVLGDARLDRDVKVGNVIFRKGNTVKIVLEACRRALERTMDGGTNPPEMPEALSLEDIKNVDQIFDQTDRFFVPYDTYVDLQKEIEQIRQNQHEYPPPSFQQRVVKWVLYCLGSKKQYDKRERDFRFAEESCELIQARGNMTEDEMIEMVKRVFAGKKGEVHQEIGGTVTCLAALVATERNSSGDTLDMFEEGERELARIWNNVEKIREKNLTKMR